jgi:hypothetical protein
VHLKAGRTGLAHKMLEREPSPAGVPADVWQALKMLIASHAGSRSALADADLRRVALYFRTLTRAGLIPAAEPALK